MALSPIHRRALRWGVIACVIHATSSGAASLSRTNLMQYLARDGSVQTVQTTNDWNQRRQSVLAAMQTVMGSRPAPVRGVPEVKVEEETDCGDYLRRRITYRADAGTPVPAFLLVPKTALTANRSVPAVLALHQTHPLGYRVVVGLGDSPNDEYGVELVRRGYVILAPAYPLLADYQPDLKASGHESGTMKAIADNIRGLDLLESLPYVRPGRFGAIGHSLGGHNALYTAAFDERLRVVVSSCGFDSFRDYKNGDITGWTSSRYMPRLRAHAPDDFPFDFHEILGALAPRVILISAPIGDTNFKWRSVDKVVAAARPVFELYRASTNLHVEHPDCGHLFPSAQRENAYRLFDRHLRPLPN